MKRYIILVTTSAACALLASGCAQNGSSSAGGAEASAYCTSFAASEAAFRDMGSGDIASFGEAFAVFHDLAAQSPDAISPEWQTLDGAFVALEQGLATAGLDIEQLDAVVSKGRIPKGVDVVALQKVMDEMARARIGGVRGGCRGDRAVRPRRVRRGPGVMTTMAWQPPRSLRDDVDPARGRASDEVLARAHQHALAWLRSPAGSHRATRRLRRGGRGGAG